MGPLWLTVYLWDLNICALQKLFENPEVHWINEVGFSQLLLNVIQGVVTQTLPTKSREELLGLLGEMQGSSSVLDMFKDSARLSMVMGSHRILTVFA